MEYGLKDESGKKLPAETLSNSDNSSAANQAQPLTFIGIFPPNLVKENSWVDPLVKDRVKTKNALGQPQLITQINFNGTQMNLSCKFSKSIIAQPFKIEDQMVIQSSQSKSKGEGKAERKANAPLQKKKSNVGNNIVKKKTGVNFKVGKPIVINMSKGNKIRKTRILGTELI